MSEENKSLMERLTRLARLLHHYQMMSLRSHGPFGNPHRGQGRVLSILKMQPEISQKDLGYLLDMRNQSLGELLAKLEKSGLITRTASEEDRRTTNIKLTSEGAAAAARIDESKRESDEIITSLTEDEQKTFCSYLDRVIAELEQRLADAGSMPGGMESWSPHFGGRCPEGPPHGYGDGRFGGPNREDIRHFAHLRRSMGGMGHGPMPGFSPGHGMDHDPRCGFWDNGPQEQADEDPIP